MTNGAFNQAIQLHAEGVDFLKSASSSQAMVCFQRALGLMKAAVYEFDNSPVDTAHDNNFIVQLRPSAAPLPDLQTGYSYVFDRSLMVVDDREVLNNEKVLLLNCAIILFNFALSCHQDGNRGGRRSLQKASQLYNMTLQVLMDADMQGDDPSSAVIALLALNNRAQIHYEMLDYQESRVCLMEMSSIMTAVQQSLENCGALRSEDIEGILLNIMMLGPPSAAQAA